MLTETEAYLMELKELREQAGNLIEGLSQEALDWQPIQGTGELATNSLAAIVVHLAGSETFWMSEVIGGKPIQRNRDAEFTVRGITLTELKSRLNTAGRIADEILASLTEKQLAESRKHRDRFVSVRWCILHVIEHLSLHVGHMQLTRQLWLARTS